MKEGFMRFVFALLVTLVISGCLMCFAQQTPAAADAAPLTSLEETLMAQSKAVPQAEKSKDTEALQRLLTDDFRQVGSEGALHEKRDLLDDAKDGRLTNFTVYNFKVLSL